MPKVIEKPRERIISEASQLLRTQGYSALTVQALAKNCGMAVGTVYNYFSSKDELTIACIARDWTICAGIIDTAARDAQTCDDVILCIYEQINRFGREHADVFENEAAASSVDAALYRYMWYVSGQIALPLRRFCSSDEQAQLIAEALITWTRTGKRLEDIRSSITKLL